MEKSYRKKILQQAEKAAIDGNTVLAAGLVVSGGNFKLKKKLKVLMNFGK